MASTCSVYKHGLRLGGGSASAGSLNITSYSGSDPKNGRNVQVVIEQSGTHTGRSFATRVLAGSGTATLTLKDACPFVGA